MTKEYKIKPRQPLPQDVTQLDRKKKAKVEKVLGKTLSEREWFDYKLMIQGIKR